MAYSLLYTAPTKYIHDKTLGYQHISISIESTMLLSAV